MNVALYESERQYLKIYAAKHNTTVSNLIHASIEVTLNIYTHLETGDIQEEFNRVVGTSDRYNFYPLDRTPAIVSLADDSPEDEGEPDMDWEPDEDD